MIIVNTTRGGLIDEPRLVLSPHIGGVTADAYVKMGVAAVRNALAVLQAGH